MQGVRFNFTICLDNYDIPEVNSIVLNDSGQKKLLDKMRDEVYSSFGEPTLEQRYLVVSVVAGLAGLSAGSAPGGVGFQ